MNYHDVRASLSNKLTPRQKDQITVNIMVLHYPDQFSYVEVDKNELEKTKTED